MEATSNASETDNHAYSSADDREEDVARLLIGLNDSRRKLDAALIEFYDVKEAIEGIQGLAQQVALLDDARNKISQADTSMNSCFENAEEDIKMG